MNLVNIINTFSKSEIGTFLLCDKHFEQLKASDVPDSIFRIRELTNHVEGECIECTEGEATPITFDEPPENLEVFVTFNDDSGETWSASSRAGRLTYVADKQGGIYTTMEALRRRGVEKLYIEAGYELLIDV